MNVLIAFASKHGSTGEIARIIAQDLENAGITVELREAGEVDAVDEFDAVILGSSIYVGQWQKDALTLIDRTEAQLRDRQVWLFSSGPVGADPFPAGEPPITSELIERTGANEHQSFTGKLDRATLGFGERLITGVTRAPEGDFRDWDAIRAWAAYIARTLKSDLATTR